MDFSKLISIIFLFYELPSSFGQDCSRNGLKRFDELTSKATTFGSINLKFPETPSQLQDYCKNAYKLMNEVEMFNKKCNQKLFKQIYGIFIYAYRNTLKQHCKGNSKLAPNFLSSTSCYNKNRQAEVTCYTTFIDKILGAQNAVETKKVPHLCCSYVDYLECTKSKITKLPGCDENKVDTMNNYIRSFLDNVLNIICGDYTGENDKCANLGPPPKKTKAQRRSKTIALPTADLLISFPEV